MISIQYRYTAAFLLAVSMIILGLKPSFAQDDWHWQNPLPQGNRLNDLEIIDNQTAYAVGDDGTILKTTNGGTKWELLKTTEEMSDLNAIAFAGDQTGWAVGDSYWEFSDGLEWHPAVIYYTEDGGETWQKQESNTEERANLRDLHVVDENHARAITTENILTTDDGGQTWHHQKPEDLPGSLRAVHFTDSQNGWVVGTDATIAHTEDGGETWEQQDWEFEEAFANDLYATFFVDSDQGWAAGETIIRTDDGGQNWTEVDERPSDNMYSAHFIDEDTGWLSGDRGTIKVTHDGGESWQDQDGVNQTAFTSTRLRSVQLANTDTGWAVGDNGAIAFTGDGGIHWDLQPAAPFTIRDLRDIRFFDPDTGMVAGDSGEFLSTFDGGATWNSAMTPTTVDFRSLHFPEPDSGWVVGRDEIWKVTGKGRSWEEQESGIDEMMETVHFINYEQGWIATGSFSDDDAVILHTNDGGETWQEIFRDEQEGSIEFSEIQFSDEEVGWVSGIEYPRFDDEKGFIWRTEDGGETWEEQYAAEEVYVNGFHFTDQETGWLATYANEFGIDEGVWSTDNGGETWEPEMVDTDRRFSIIDMHVEDENTVWALGSDGVWHSEDSGDSWSVQSIPMSGSGSIHFADPGHGWIVGTGGAILHNTIGDQPPVISELLTPPDGQEQVEAPVLFDWEPVAEAASYQFQLSGHADFQELTLNRTGLFDSQLEVENQAYFEEFDTYYWRVRASNAAGAGAWSEPYQFYPGEAVSSDQEPGFPEEVSLAQNYPNPFNPVTRISYSLPGHAEVRLEVFDVLGRRVATLVDEEQQPGRHAIDFDGSDLASGTYIYRLKTGGQIHTKQMMLVK